MSDSNVERERYIAELREWERVETMACEYISACGLNANARERCRDAIRYALAALERLPMLEAKARCWDAQAAREAAVDRAAGPDRWNAFWESPERHEVDRAAAALRELEASCKE